MHAERDLDLHHDDPNTYDRERDGPIDLPVAAALERAERILRSKSDAEILDLLVEAKAHAKFAEADDQSAFESSDMRITFLALNFAANVRDLLAPVFRERLRPAIRRSNQGQEQLPKLIDAIYSLDRQLVDLHWLCCREVERGVSTSPKVDDKHIWKDGALDPEAAEHFVQLGWQAIQKAKTLQITADDQLELSVLRSTQVKDIHHYVMRNKDSDMAVIKGYCLKNKQLAIEDVEPMYADLLALRLAKKDITLAARLRRLMNRKLEVSSTPESQKRLLRRRSQLFSGRLRLLQ